MGFFKQYFWEFQKVKHNSPAKTKSSEQILLQLKQLKESETEAEDCLWSNMHNLFSEILDKSMTKEHHAQEYVLFFIMYITFLLIYDNRYARFLNLNAMYWNATWSMFVERAEHLNIATRQAFHAKNMFLAVRGFTGQLFNISSRIADLCEKHESEHANVTFFITLHELNHPHAFTVTPVNAKEEPIRDDSKIQYKFSGCRSGDFSIGARNDIKSLLFQLALRMFCNPLKHI